MIQLRDLLIARSGVRAENRRALLTTLMIRPDSQVNLSKRARLSAATVSDAVRDLEAEGHVRGERIGREIIVRMAQTAGVAVGIELGRHATAVVARRVDQEYADSAFRVVQVGIARGIQVWLPGVVQAVREVADDLDQDDIVVVGLGVPWMVDPRAGKLVPPALPPWKEGEDPAELLASALRQELGDRMTAPRVILDNDSNLLAYGESIYASPDAETLIGVKASTGIGAGIVVGGSIFRGGRGVAGELGHTSVHANGRFCSCGGRGCLETFIGTDVLVEQARQALGNQRSTAPANFEDLAAAANRGSLACQRVLQDAARTLGLALGNLCNILNPNVVVFGGALGRDDVIRFTLDACKEGIRRTGMRAAVTDGEEFTVRESTVRYAAAHGALAVALQGTVYRP